MGHIARDCTGPRGNGGGGDNGGSGGQRQGGRVFALTYNQAAGAPGTISGTLLVGSRGASVLFDTGSTHLIVAQSFVRHLSVPSQSLDPALSIATPMGTSVVISDLYRECPINLGDKIREANLLTMDMHDFDVILGMDWLDKHQATIDCQAKTVIFGDLKSPEFVFQGSWPSGVVKLISALKAAKLVTKGCEGYLAVVKDTPMGESHIEDVPVVCEFPDVFPEELSGLPPPREVEFTIELVPGAEPISKAPYRMAPLELQELKEQFKSC